MNQLFCSNSSSAQHPTKDYTPSSRSISRKNPSIANVYPSYAPVFCSRHLGQRRPLPGLPGGGPGAVERGQAEAALQQPEGAQRRPRVRDHRLQYRLNELAGRLGVTTPFPDYRPPAEHTGR